MRAKGGIMMLKKVLSSAIVLVSIFAFSGFVWASVEGSWGVQGNMTVKVNIKGHKSQIVREAFQDELTFYSDGSFDMTDMKGTWIQNKKKFNVNLNPADVAAYFSDALTEERETDVYVEIKKLSFTGTEQKNGTIKGTIKLNMTFYVMDYDLSGNINVKVALTGMRLVNILSKKESEYSHSHFPISILESIKEQIDSMVIKQLSYD